jgi:putative ABC transport system substrate-binding protein
MPGAVLLGVGLAVLFAAGTTDADAQPGGKTWRIGVLLGRSVPAEDPALQTFRQRLRDLGYVEGQNVAIDWRQADGRLDRLPDQAVELVRLKADVIVADVTPAIRAAMQATSTVPIVMGMAADPIGSGLVSNLARPGGNVTGVSVMLADVSGKRLQLLKDALPRISRVAVLWNPSIPWHTAMLAEVEPAARSLGLHLLPVAVAGPGELEAAFSAMARWKVDAVFLGDSPIFSVQRARLLELAAKHRLPMIFGNQEWVAAGGLMSYGPSFSDMFGRAAVYVDKILKGARPGDLPVEQPTKVDLIINLKTAKALGLTIQPSVLARADQVIQ